MQVISLGQELGVQVPSISEFHPWYAVRTRSKCERLAVVGLESKGYETYSPCYRSRRRWSDRVVETEMPLFAGYVFCRFDVGKRLPVITTPGVVSIIGFGSEPVPILDPEIEAIQIILGSGLAAEPYPFLREGQRIRIKKGALQELEGILVRKKNEWRMIVSVTMLQRSMSVEIDRESIETI